MVGQLTVTKPSRSDEVLDVDQQIKMVNQMRGQFDSLAPKRASKPNRSEPDHSTCTNTINDSTTIIPELDKLRWLQSQSHVIFNGNVAMQDEFVETQYYQELVSIDKQHHTTGSGFIRMMKEENMNGFKLGMGGSGHGGERRVHFKSNPATNDWIPSVEEEDDAQLMFYS